MGLVVIIGVFLFFLFKNSNKNISINTNIKDEENIQLTKVGKDENNNIKINNNLLNQEKKTKNKKEIKVVFAGDLMFDRYIRQIAQQKGNNFIFQKVSDYLKAVDLVVLNLEGPITNNQSKSVGTEIGEKNHMFFTFEPDLAQQNIKIVNLGNNHILNFGEDGLNQTINYLEQNKIKYFEDTGKDFLDRRYLIFEINDIKLGLVNYNNFAKNSAEHALNDINEIKSKVDLVFVYTHWGQEYKVNHNKS